MEHRTDAAASSFPRAALACFALFAVAVGALQAVGLEQRTPFSVLVPPAGVFLISLVLAYRCRRLGLPILLGAGIAMALDTRAWPIVRGGGVPLICLCAGLAVTFIRCDGPGPMLTRLRFPAALLAIASVVGSLAVSSGALMDIAPPILLACTLLSLIVEAEPGTELLSTVVALLLAARPFTGNIHPVLDPFLLPPTILLGVLFIAGPGVHERVPRGIRISGLLLILGAVTLYDGTMVAYRTVMGVKWG
jgi:hypothetical protein